MIEKTVEVARTDSGQELKHFLPHEALPVIHKESNIGFETWVTQANVGYSPRCRTVLLHKQSPGKFEEQQRYLNCEFVYRVRTRVQGRGFRCLEGQDDAKGAALCWQSP